MGACCVWLRLSPDCTCALQQHSHHKILGHRENVRPTLSLTSVKPAEAAACGWTRCNAVWHEQVIKHEMRVAEESPSGFAVTWGQDWLHNAVKKVRAALQLAAFLWCPASLTGEEPSAPGEEHVRAGHQGEHYRVPSALQSHVRSTAAFQ